MTSDFALSRGAHTRLASFALALGALLCSSACQPSSSGSLLALPRPPELPSNPQSTLAGPGASPLPNAGASEQALAEQLLARAARQSGLAPARPPSVLLVDRSALVGVALARARQDLPPPLEQAYAETLAALELVPANFDYFDALERVYGERLAAFYDPERARVYLSHGLSHGRRESALAHELAHFLQDRAFQLGQRLHDPRLTQDQRSALQALSEGAATVLGNRILEDAVGSGESAEEPSELAPERPWPDILARSLEAAYADGSELVSTLVEQQGWGAVHLLLAAPPPTTAQLLHPERLGESIAAARTLPSPGQGWVESRSDALGEQCLRTVLEQSTSGEAARDAASGWRADRVALFHRDGRRALAWRVELSGALEADRLLNATRQAWLSPLDEAGAGPGWCRPHRDRGVIGAHSRGRIAVLLNLEPEETPEGLDGCRALQVWAEQLLALPAGVATRVGTASQVQTDPAAPVLH